jgi:hypothetical protein
VASWATEIKRCYQGVKQFETLLFRAVHRGRRAGMSWPEIGKAMGISHQAAWRRFHSFTEE